jgi:signal transduction histidine kinase
MKSYSPNGVDPNSSSQARSEDAKRARRGWRQPLAMSVVLRYGLALFLVSVALVLAQAFLYYGLPQPFAAQAQPFTALALCATAITFWYGGTKPGVLAALISWLFRDYLFEPEISTESRLLYGLVFLVFALVMTLIMRGRNEREAKVVERTAELLAASLAHETKQPIASARNNARAAMHFLDRNPPDLGEVREALACVVADADRAGDIIDRIRDHITRAPPRKGRFDLNKAINEVIALAESAITTNGVSVRTRLAEALLPVQGDRVQMQQVVLNLILNAVEAMSTVEAGPRELLISTEPTQSGRVLVSVRDSGPGIDPDHLEHVFDAFYTTKSSGTGMGLSICRSIIEAHGGRLWADANKPRGAVFQFTLPNAENS